VFSSFFREITSFAEFCTFCSELTLKRNLVKAYCEIKQVQKVLWTRKAPACLLILLYAYGMPRLPPVHKYSSLRSTAHRPAAGRCSGRWATRTALTV